MARWPCACACANRPGIRGRGAPRDARTSSARSEDIGYEHGKQRPYDSGPNGGPSRARPGDIDTLENDAGERYFDPDEWDDWIDQAVKDRAPGATLAELVSELKWRLLGTGFLAHGEVQRLETLLEEGVNKSVFTVAQCPTSGTWTPLSPLGMNGGGPSSVDLCPDSTTVDAYVNDAQGSEELLIENLRSICSAYLQSPQFLYTGLPLTHGDWDTLALQVDSQAGGCQPVSFSPDPGIEAFQESAGAAGLPVPSAWPPGQPGAP